MQSLAEIKTIETELNEISRKSTVTDQIILSYCALRNTYSIQF